MELHLIWIYIFSLYQILREKWKSKDEICFINLSPEIIWIKELKSKKKKICGDGCKQDLLWSFSFWGKKNLFIYLATPGLGCSTQDLCWGMWDLVPWLGIEPRPPALGAQSLTHWTTREVPLWSFCSIYIYQIIMLYT